MCCALSNNHSVEWETFLEIATTLVSFIERLGEMLPPTRLPWLRPVGHRRCLSSATLQQGAAQLFVRPPRWGVVALAKGKGTQRPN